jgi:NADPH-dependent curcumin reductase CurA
MRERFLTRIATQRQKMEAYSQIILASRPKGPPTLSDFRLETGPIPAPAEGQILLKTTYLSLDP